MTRFLASILVLMLCALAWSSAAVAGSSGGINVRLFIDHDGDGQLDPADVPLANEWIRVWGPVSQEEHTGAHGTASFNNLPAGEYNVGSTGGTMCADYLSYNWLGTYVLGFCTSNYMPSATVTIAESEEASVDLAVQGVEGHIGGNLWLDGSPAPDDTPIAARIGGVVCAEDDIQRSSLYIGIDISRFSLEFTPETADPVCNGDIIGLFAGERQFAEMTRSQMWAYSLMSWEFGTTFYSTSNYADPPLSNPYFVSPDLGRASIHALVGDTVCGAQVAYDSAVYGLLVLPDEVKPGCGKQGDDMRFCLGGVLAESAWTWDGYIGGFLPNVVHPSDEPCPVPPVVGDTDCDGAVTVADGQLALEHAADIGDAPAAATCLPDADTDCNRKVEIPDVLAILRHLAAISAPSGGECPPVGQPNY